MRKSKCFQGSLKENWWIWNLKIEGFLEICLGFFELFKFDVSMQWRKQDHMHHHNFGSSLNMTLEWQFATIFSWWQAFTFCSSMAIGDDYLKFDEGEKIFNQSPYLLFCIAFSISWLSFFFFFCQKAQTCDALYFFYLLGISSFVIHLCFTFTITNCVLKSPFFHIHGHLFSSPFPCYSYHGKFIFKN